MLVDGWSECESEVVDVEESQKWWHGQVLRDEGEAQEHEQANKQASFVRAVEEGLKCVYVE